MTAALEPDAGRSEIVLDAQAAAATDDHLVAGALAGTVAEGVLADDVLMQLSATAVAACWPAPPYGGWAELDTACLRALDVHVRGNR